MDDLISRQAAIAQSEEICHWCGCEERYGDFVPLDAIKSLPAADAVVLPCKVGDTVYFRTFANNATVDLGIQPHKVIAYRLSMVCEGRFVDTALPDYEFGRSVFLDREEAEKALERSVGDG